MKNIKKIMILAGSIALLTNHTSYTSISSREVESKTTLNFDPEKLNTAIAIFTGSNDGITQFNFFANTKNISTPTLKALVQKAGGTEEAKALARYFCTTPVLFKSKVTDAEIANYIEGMQSDTTVNPLDKAIATPYKSNAKDDLARLQAAQAMKAAAPRRADEERRARSSAPSATGTASARTSGSSSSSYTGSTLPELGPKLSRQESRDATATGAGAGAGAGVGARGLRDNRSENLVQSSTNSRSASVINDLNEGLQTLGRLSPELNKDELTETLPAFLKACNSFGTACHTNRVDHPNVSSTASSSKQLGRLSSKKAKKSKRS